MTNQTPEYSDAELLARITATYYNVDDPGEIHTVGDAFEGWEPHLAADTEWAHYVDPDRREAHFAMTYYLHDSPDDKTMILPKYFHLGDMIEVAEDRVDTIVEKSDYPTDRVHAEIGSVDQDDLPIPMLTVEHADIHGIDVDTLEGAEDLRKVLSYVTSGPDGGQSMVREEKTLQHEQRGTYAPEETGAYLLDEWMYRNVPRELAEGRMLCPEDWYDDLER